MANKHYDLNLKLAIVNDYFKEGLGYKKLASKYQIHRDTIRNWILRAKFNMSSKEAISKIEETKFIDITDKIKHYPTIQTEDVFTLHLNGFSITTNYKTLKALVEVIKDDRLK